MKVIFFVFRLFILGVFFPIGTVLLADEIVKGTVLSIDKENDKFTVQLDNGKTVEAQVSPGDAQINYVNKQIQGKLINGKPPRLEGIWPADPTLEAQAKEYNSGATTGGKSKAQRKVGDMFPAFALYNQDTKLVTDKDIQGKLVVANFIFTSCTNPEMCPASTRRMADLQQVLKNKGLDSKVRLVTFTFDPERDTPGVLKHYAKSYQITNDNYMFLTGNPEVVEKITKQLGIFTINRNGTVSHTMNTVLIDKNGKILYSATGPKWSVDDFIGKIQSQLAKKEVEE